VDPADPARSDDPADLADSPDVADLPDAVLVRRAALGDRTAFAAVVRRHGEAVFRYAVGMLGDRPDDAEDTAQAVWIKAWQHLDSYRGEAQLRTWLFRITANEVLNTRRRSRPVAVDDELLTPLPGPAERRPDRLATEHELRDALMLALAELPWRQRASWVLAELEGLSYQEIAHLLDTSVTVVRGQLHRARRTLTVRMEQWR
jgi:RNA polymerase sigma-70 factor (ECF subfamily)